MIFNTKKGTIYVYMQDIKLYNLILKGGKYLYLVFLAISFLASIIGSICGIGGGVIIKPLLDATEILSVSTVSFLSGCTVLSMSLVSVITVSYQSKKLGVTSIELREGTPLAIGAAIGGIFGKAFFQIATEILQNDNKVGAIQAAILVFMTLGTLIYTVNSRNIKSYNLKNRLLCVLIGLALGILSSFLGIGGGPINLVVLAFFFSMPIKKAAMNSLYIILFSQSTSFLSTVIGENVPKFDVIVLVLMVSGGITGALIGKSATKKISSKLVHKLFIILMTIIVGINILNFIKFSA